MANQKFVPLSYYLPSNIFDFIEPSEDFYDKIGIVNFELEVQEDVKNEQSVYTFSIGSEEISFKIPGLEGIEFVIESTEVEGASPFTVELKVSDEETSVEAGVRFKLRFDRSILKPMVERTKDGRVYFEEDPDRDKKVEVELGEIRLGYNSNGGFYFNAQAGEEGESFDISIQQPVMIGDTGVILKNLNFSLNIDGKGNKKPEGAPDDWKGLYIKSAQLYIPDVMDGSIEIEGFGIGTGGIWGRVEREAELTVTEDNGIEFNGGIVAGEVMGMKGGISSIAIEFCQSIPVEFDIKGKVLFPFFDEPVDVSIGIGVDGDFHVSLSDTDEDGMFMLRKENILEAKVESIAFEKKEDLFIASIKGSIRPLVGGIDWPEFDVESLSIDSKGNVHIDGGWIDVPDKLSFDFHGFKMEVTKVGFGTDEDGNGEYRWIGLSGGIQIVEGIEAGATVEGLKIKWWDNGNTDIELKGVGINFEIPDVLKFDGEVEFFSNGVNGFKGDINLNLITVGLELDASLIAGRNEDPPFNFFYIYLDVELPAGIPLGSSGAGIYGMAGLFGYNMEPDKEENEEWYEGWYKRNSEGATSTDKWIQEKDSLALGAGTTIATIADNGYLVSARVLLVIVIPGPVIIIEGRASFLKKRSKLDEEGQFKALAVIDNKAGQFLMNIEAEYRLKEKGRVLDIHGGAEAFFDYHKTNNWHLYLGEDEPKEKRIRAKILSLFEANTYFMLEPTNLKFGYWAGFDKRWKFGPVKIVASAWQEADINACWKPEQFWGRGWMHGELEVKVFWFDLGFCLDAGMEINTPNPFYLLLHIEVKINLPWPLPDFDIEIDMKWEEEKEPPVPLPVKEVAVAHEMVQENIVLQRGSLLLPDYDSNDDEFIDDPNVQCEEPNEPSEIPVVPLDARPVITFGKPVWDTAKVADNSRPLDPEWLTLGHQGNDENLKDYKYKFELVSLVLEKKTDSGWVEVAYAGDISNPPDKKIKGVWLPVEDGDGKLTQTKLMLWTKTPFSYTRYSSRDYLDSFLEDNPDYPCVPDYKAKETCVNFEDATPGRYNILEHRGIKFTSAWEFEIETGKRCRSEYKRCLCFSIEDTPSFYIAFPEPVCKCVLKMNLFSDALIEVDNQKGETIKSIYLNKGESEIKIDTEDREECNTDKINIKTLKITTKKQYLGFCLYEICYIPVSEVEKEKENEEYRKHISESVLATWSDEGNILEPYTTYRLKINTKVTVKKGNNGEKETNICEYAYFKTEGPPGFVNLEAKNIPSLSSNSDEISHEHPLNRLNLYVKDTIPKKGQNPFYRAYDVGIEFNRDYVELMYKIAKHDLGIYLFDNNGNPVKDAFGRIITLGNMWGKAETLELWKDEDQYVSQLENSTCINIKDSISRQDVLKNSVKERFLLPQKLYEVRVIPMLLHETFDNYQIENDKIVVEGNTGTSSWQIIQHTNDKTYYYLSQTGNVYNTVGGELDEPACRGTYYIFGESEWTDYRVTVVLSSEGDGSIGVMFRYKKSDDSYDCYRFSMNRERGYRRLVKMKGSNVEILAEDDFVYEKGKTYEVVIEAKENSIKVFFDGQILFDVEDEDIDSGAIAMYSYSAGGFQEFPYFAANFYEIMVEDLSENAKCVYSFPFTTSRYANFYHHIHSFNDRVWEEELPLNSNLNRNSFEEIWPAVIEPPQQLDISAVKKDNEYVGFLIKSPEPIEWERVELEIQQNDNLINLGVPGIVKLTSFERDSGQSRLQLLVREDTALNGWKIEYATNPENPQWKEYYAFKGLELFSKTEFTDEDFVTLQNVEGKYLIKGDINWKNYSYTADFELGGTDDEAGILFRYLNKDNYYKVVVSNSGGLKLYKKRDGNITCLWSSEEDENNGFISMVDSFMENLINNNLVDRTILDGKKKYRITVEVKDTNIRLLFNGETYFEIDDTENPIPQGCIGAFFLNNAEVVFNELTAVSLDRLILPSGQLIEISNSLTRKLPSYFTEDRIRLFGEEIIPELITPSVPSESTAWVFRIVNEKGEVVHQREFPIENNFTRVDNTTMIFSEDRSKAFIKVDFSENKLYRFNFVFHRKREDLPTLRQWGDDRDENVSIDFKIQESGI